MKTSALAVALLSLLPAALAAETAGPSPTESYGCEPHGDHYHCEGLRATLSTSVTEAAAAATTTEAHDHDEDEDEDEHDHSAGTASAGASPTESWGCEPHGDHYHCEGSRATLTTVVSSAAAATTTAESETHDHDHEDEETASAAASPTESYGCEPHGDHWHCDGARTATEAGSDSTPTANATPTDEEESTATPTNNAAGMDIVPVLGLVAAAVFAL
ncbi:hypothetical protein B0T10DRAFT_575951 [Thelonectria olida]|uniref:Uncharacterized protein n=1 Tax=Thelonectria olida TaxID=1576542 RepID=A0A9P8W140_9HYPO|nr:hypothetical protein B0T10DRAFT_575951 [Thelonectria olida]